MEVMQCCHYVAAFMTPASGGGMEGVTNCNSKLRLQDVYGYTVLSQANLP
jgi:hypothetical protein